jgi:hypothetical protein
MTKLLPIPLVALALYLNACQLFPVTQPNTDVVINAEKTLRLSKDTFDLFLHLEKDNQAFVKSKLPQVHVFAQNLRKNAPDWLITANNLKNDYKHGNGDLNALMAALNILTQNISTAKNYINQINNKP